MVFIISIILAIIALIIIGLILRKRVYDTVDKLESWKLDIMNRNVAADLSRMKELNLSGETEEKFEKWRKRWDSIITTELGDIEELLYDAEYSADRYRFKTAKKLTVDIEHHLNNIENDLDDMLRQLNELLKAEEESRKGIEQLKPKIKELRTYILQNQAKFSRATVRYEVEFDELDEMVNTYVEMIENGNYEKGKQTVDELKERIELVEKDIEQFPELYQQCKIELPRQLDKLFDGIQEMKKEEYRLESFSLEKEINEYQARLLDCVRTLEKTGIDKVKSVITEIEERIQEMYDLLEKEAIAKNFVESKFVSIVQSFEQFKEQFKKTKEEVEQLKEAYHFNDDDLESYLALDKTFDSIETNISTLTKSIEEKKEPHSKLRRLLEDGIKQIDRLNEEHEQFLQRIETLRKDEMEARERVEKMRRQIYDTNRKLRRSNIPGVPNFIWTLLDEAASKNEHVLTILDQQPIDILDVQKTLSEAKEAVDRVMDEADNVIEQAFLTERVIQYANRYRSMSPDLAEKLSQAEALFRKSNYELALELAAKAVEEVEPGALKRIEEQIESVS